MYAESLLALGRKEEARTQVNLSQKLFDEDKKAAPALYGTGKPNEKFLQALEAIRQKL